MTAAPRHTSQAQAGGAQPARTDNTPQQKAGRPQGAPATIVNRRLPVALWAQLARAIDRLEVQTGRKATRGMLARRAGALFLATRATGSSQLSL
jgi:hypothetical protein